MGMRTMEGVVLDEQAKKDIYQAYMLQTSQTSILPTFRESDMKTDIREILVDDREEKVELYEEQGLCEFDGISLKLTNT